MFEAVRRLEACSFMCGMVELIVLSDCFGE